MVVVIHLLLAYLTLGAGAVRHAGRVLSLAARIVLYDACCLVVYVWSTWPYRVPARVAFALWVVWMMSEDMHE